LESKLRNMIRNIFLIIFSSFLFLSVKGIVNYDIVNGDITVWQPNFYYFYIKTSTPLSFSIETNNTSRYKILLQNFYQTPDTVNLDNKIPGSEIIFDNTLKWNINGIRFDNISNNL
jgi:hypothetical protein